MGRVADMAGDANMAGDEVRKLACMRRYHEMRGTGDGRNGRWTEHGYAVSSRSTRFRTSATLIDARRAAKSS